MPSITFVCNWAFVWVLWASQDHLEVSIVLLLVALVNQPDNENWNVYRCLPQLIYEFTWYYLDSKTRRKKGNLWVHFIFEHKCQNPKEILKWNPSLHFRQKGMSQSSWVHPSNWRCNILEFISMVFYSFKLGEIPNSVIQVYKELVRQVNAQF